MNKPSDSDPSLLREYQREFSNKFAPLQLWSDRRRILADPAIAAQSPSPLANSPVRFALSLQLVPILFIGWLVSALVGLVVSDEQRVDAYAGKLAPAIALLEEHMGHPADEPLAETARQAGVQHMHPQAKALWFDLVKIVALRATGDDATVRDSAADWLQRLEASEVSREHRDVLKAKALRYLRSQRDGGKFQDTVMRSLTQGGVLMQVTGVFSLLFSAWLLGQMLRGDARFVLAQRADRFYLYYSTSLIFWLLLAKLAFFGVGSFAYAAGKPALFNLSQAAQLATALVTMIWLLWHSGVMARVLCDAQVAPKGAAFSVAWRIVVASVVSVIVMTVVGGVVGLAAGIASSMLRG